MLDFANLLAGIVLNSNNHDVYFFLKRCWGNCSFLCRPIFSSEFINTDKNKMERFLHPGRFSIGSIYAPISFPALPLIILKKAGEDAAPTVAAVGSLKTIDPDRIILKRVILTG